MISAKQNKLIKIITGIRRCGKSFLLDPLFRNHLLQSDIKENHIIKIDFDERRNRKFLDPDILDEYLRSQIIEDDMYYLLLDEIQLVEGFESVLNGLLKLENVDIYVTGSNSKFLSSDIVTEFRGRGTQIRVYPLSFSEYYHGLDVDKYTAYQDYITYGGMPVLLNLRTNEEKAQYLKELIELTYIKDIIERNKIHKDTVLETLLDILASNIGSLTNPHKITNTFKNRGFKELSINTIIQYLSYLLDSFLILKADRYDVKGKKYIQSPLKYYYTDIGLRNARLNFRHQEENYIMENIVFLELLRRDYNVDVGVVEVREKNTKKRLEVDFVCNQYDKRLYIQVALNLETREKTIQEQKTLLNIPDNFKKIIIVKDSPKPWYTEEGILVLGILDFLLDENSINM